MTFRELINNVNFEDVAPHIVRMYPDMKDSLGWFNLIIKGQTLTCAILP